MSNFIKFNQSPFKDALFQEVNGLERLRQQISNHQIPYLKVPEIYSVTDSQLIVEHIKLKSANTKQMYNLGEGLALLHQIDQKQYGLNQSNYIGLSVQSNSLTDNWGRFFVDHRLMFQVEMIKDDLLKNSFRSTLQKHKSDLMQFLNLHCDQPSLVHGDLWSGNVLFDEKLIWLIDPAVYFADREVDIAMTEMFGGFDIEFYQAYNEHYPLSSAYQNKKIIYNLYHYLNHYNIFGGGYLSSCLSGFEFLSSVHSLL